MENTLLIGLSRQVALARELDVIANNMANVNTNGFKARSSLFAEYIMPEATADEFPLPDRSFSYVIDNGTPLDFSTGALERTGNPMDVAIKGEAFFVVETPNGERYTRNGALQLDQTGRLVTSDGWPILGDGGEIVFNPEETGISIGRDGAVSTDQGQRGRIRLVRFEDVQALRNEGANVFASDEPGLPALESSKIESGVIERSNVNAVIEMSRMMEVNRSYTAIANTLQRLAELQRTAVQRLGEAV
jgi:flagellar basal-body rod protein FlgF